MNAEEALAENIDVKAIIDEGLTNGMNEVGNRTVSRSGRTARRATNRK